MKNENELKEIVREKYSQIALNEREVNAASCCGATPTSEEVYNVMSDDYTDLDGYAADADLGLGCGLPTEFAQISNGDTVIDLGSGAGNDAFIARHETGPEGKVIGIDFTEAMIDRSRINADKLGFNNVEFRYGDIENMPISENTADVIVSNCVLNLVPNKKGVINDTFRVLKPGGHFSISDIVLIGDLPDELREDAEMYAGCVSGAIQKSEYMGLIEKAGFDNITIQKEKAIRIPSDILLKYMGADRVAQFNQGETGIYSVTVYAEKPGQSSEKKVGQEAIQHKAKVKIAEIAGADGEACCGPNCC
ncbi:MAG: arsenite methyltransferase [Flavobacteriales bacterium]|nr:arsenite methyltransferase [Flavobacteriales bacterium]NCG29434.1 arsenite methyltransferase [Bacteroidota bacterium]MBT3963113.1 arsenite methyltransferase [Flavobacteriales bacterium]MBT4706065.1 arsenite methyltransferase [Flavobacteriales bacterium]MBT4930688.1 arsenite methyltransferase [Flavobacteriales bacterium]